jgi:hypothetical protein
MRGRAVREIRFLLLFVALAAAHTWPLVTGLDSLSRHDSADALLNEWILAWDAHALATAPLHIFDANIFFPERHTLAFSEHLLAQSILTSPLIWLGVPTLAAHNLALIIGLALTGWTMSLVVTRWTGDRWAGLVSGCLLAFNAHTLTRLAHVQAMHVEFLPLALAALDRLLARSPTGSPELARSGLTGPRLRTAAALAGWSVLQALCSGYLLVMTAFALVVAALVRPRDWIGRDRLGTAAALALSAVVSAVLLAPTLWPYVQVRREQGLVRVLDEVTLFSATPQSYLSTGGRLHYALWSERFFSPDSLFPGLVGLGLTVAALIAVGARRDLRVRMLMAIGLVGVVLSFGPRLPEYVWLYRALPLLQGLRGAARFGLLALVAVAVLAGFGLAWLRRTRIARSPLARTALAALAVAGVNVEAWRAPIHWTPAIDVSPVYESLARERVGPVVEIPFPSALRADANGVFVLASTRHFRPLLNGYSGFVPASYAAHAARLAQFPDDASHRLLVELGVTHVLVHGAASSDVQRRASQTPWLAHRVQLPTVTLYAVR